MKPRTSVDPEETAITAKKRKSIEYETLLAANIAETLKRIADLRLIPPWPPEPFCKMAGLQPIKNQWDVVNRAWRVKRGVFRNGLILASVATYEHQVWYHVSFSLKDKVPTYEQMMFVKEAMFSPSNKVIQVLPARSEHYNLHLDCLHLWTCLEGDRLPDFRTLGMV
jgi:hypothetical protein